MTAWARSLWNPLNLIHTVIGTRRPYMYSIHQHVARWQCTGIFGMCAMSVTVLLRFEGTTIGRLPASCCGPCSKTPPAHSATRSGQPLSCGWSPWASRIWARSWPVGLLAAMQQPTSDLKKRCNNVSDRRPYRTKTCE
jgi:hypothetical protein